ncbi:MAG: OmpA family protein [Deltaproteobacteria bacterium]|nr:OmpA family protein [Deltaproteobacteria bacterium]
MVNKAKKLMFMSFVMAMVITLAAVVAEAKQIPRVDNFVILIDQSGSMFMEHKERKEVKALLVKKMLLEMNKRIPELGYTAAIQGFYPEETLIGPQTYSRYFFEQEIEKLPEKGKIFGNLTPLGTEIEALDKVMSGFSGKTSVIVISDGQVNEGKDPYEAAKAITNEYTNICFDVISLADSPEGEETLRKINSLGTCTFADGEEMMSDLVAIETFLSNVLYMEVADVATEEMRIQEVAPNIITVGGGYFGFDSAEINEAAWTAIANVVTEKLGKKPGSSLVIEGHTDSTGPSDYNQNLSERRAEAVKSFFAGKGIPAASMTTVGYGETMPRVSNTTPEGRAVNRRVDIRIVE